MKNLLFLIIVLSTFSSKLNAQQAWSQKKGEGYFQLSTSILNYEYMHIGNFKLYELPRKVHQTILSAYGEYGISDKITISANLPLHWVSLGEYNPNANAPKFDGGKLNGLGNANLSLLYNFHKQHATVISSKIDYGFNTSVNSQNNGLSTGEDSFSITPSLLIGVGKSNYFSSAEIGISWFNQRYTDRFFVNAQLGKKVTKSKKIILILGLITKFNTTLSRKHFGTLAILRADQYTALYPREQSYVALNFKMGYEISDHFICWGSLSGGEGENVGAGISYTASIAYRLKK